MSTSTSFPCYMVRKNADGTVLARVETISPDALPLGEVVIDVAWSSLNYKDAMACRGHPGIVRAFPHVPGIDCAGEVLESASDQYRSGDQVLVTGYELGSGYWGGFSKRVRVPADWVVPLPKGLSSRDSMVYGTAGFTAAQAVTAIAKHDIDPDKGDVVVTGATGGVGSLSVAILAKLGYRVVAVTGKADRHDWLRQLGARDVLDRNVFIDRSDRPLLSARWAAAVDTVGGPLLATILRAMEHRACVAACGLVAGDQLHLSVYPFLLRGATLAGIDSAKCPRPQRLEMWEKLAGPWRVPSLDNLAETVTLSQLPDRVAAMLEGQLVGRTLVEPTA